MKINPIFAAGEQISANFTGAAFVNHLVTDKDAMFNCTVYDVLFEAGSRNHWHSHVGGQLLLCTDGVGYYQEKGKPARRLQKGDIVEIAPGVVHWHGAAPDSEFSHIGISTNTQKGGVNWLGAVTDAEYMEVVRKCVR